MEANQVHFFAGSVWATAQRPRPGHHGHPGAGGRQRRDRRRRGVRADDGGAEEEVRGAALGAFGGVGGDAPQGFFFLLSMCVVLWCFWVVLGVNVSPFLNG